MITIKTQIDNVRTLGMFLLENTWAGAKDRVQDMEDDELEQLYLYLDSQDEELTETELNDFIWFDWDEIKQDLTW